MTTSRKKVRTKWEALNREYDAGEQTINDFCAQRGLNAYSFKKWRSRLGQRATPKFRELTRPDPIETYSVVLRSGRELRVAGDYSEPRLRRLIEILESC